MGRLHTSLSACSSSILKAKVVAIAGVASPMAAAAALGIPLTCQAERMAVLPALYCGRP